MAENPYIILKANSLLILSAFLKSMDYSVHVEYNDILVIILYKLPFSIEEKNLI